MKRRPQPVAPAVYTALFDISAMRDQVRSLDDGISAIDAARLLARLAIAEHAALQLLKRVEDSRSIVAH